MSAEQNPDQSLPRIFDFDPSTPIRVEITDDGEAVVSAWDLARAVGHKRPEAAYDRVSDAYKVTTFSNRSGPPRVFLREAGVYEFLLGVRLRPSSPHYQRVLDFRRWVFEEVLPSIRKTGRYEAPHAKPAAEPTDTPTLAYHHVAREFRAARAIAGMLGLDGNQLTISALRAMKRRYNADLSAEFGLQLPSPGNERILTATQIGAEIGLGDRAGAKVNVMLMHAGLQRKGEGGIPWVMTEAGKPYGVLVDVEKEHGKRASVQHLQWRESVIPMIHRPGQALTA